MLENYILDTNAYAAIFEMPRTDVYKNLEAKLRVDGVMRFSIPEIVSMEIHSVIGKFRRGGATENNMACGRNYFHGEEIKACSNVCFYPKRTRMNSKIFKGFQKLINDIEEKNGDIQATLLPLGQAELAYGKNFLQRYAHQYAFGSHDALIAGTVAAGIESGVSFTLITSDKGLKALCRAQNISVFDPRQPGVT